MYYRRIPSAVNNALSHSRTMRSRLMRVTMPLYLLMLFGLLTTFVVYATDTPDTPDRPTREFQIFLPVIQANLPTDDDGVGGSGDLIWDPRLDEREAVLIRATVTPGEGYWRLVEAQWFNAVESQGRHHILIDTRNMDGEREETVPIQIRWADGDATVQTEQKPGEEFAANYPMFALAPAYSAQPNDGAPADLVENMGLGEINEPHLAHHTSYGLIWRWTIAPAAITPTITPTATITITSTPTITATPAITVTPRITVTTTTAPEATLTPTLSTTPTPSMTPMPTGASPSPTATATPSPTATSIPEGAGILFSAEVVGCVPEERGSWFEGHVYVDEQPANGYGITFSYEPDGPKVPQQPAMSGSGGNAGFYTHILGVGVARVGDWYAWVVDSQGERISTLAAFHTDGPGGACNVATVDFTQ